MMNSNVSKPTAMNKHYHHGDLRQVLVKTAANELERVGIDALSLRKIAQLAGVSRTAPYHHFASKDDLLSAVATVGFDRWLAMVKAIAEDNTCTEHEKFARFLRYYLDFSLQNSQLYNLMFGQNLWKSGAADQPLRDVAYPSFNYMRGMVHYWQQQGVLDSTLSDVRLTQVIWGMLHGLAKLVIDGVYAETSHLDDICQCALKSFVKHPRSLPKSE